MKQTDIHDPGQVQPDPNQLSAERQAEILAEDRQRELPIIRGALSTIEKEWHKAVNRAKDPHVHLSDLHSQRDIDLVKLNGARASLLRRLGHDPESMAAPKSMKADGHEKALPDRLRGPYRRGVHLHAKLTEAVASAKG